MNNTRFPDSKLLDFVKYYDSNNPNHRNAFLKIASSLPDNFYNNDAEWVKIYRSHPAKKIGRSSAGVSLDVTYFSQGDNYRDAHRTCFSSSCAMLLNYLRPGVIRGDDDYVREVFNRGDTTDSWVQIQTLRHFGVTADYVQNANNNTLKKYLNRGIPVPCGILHKGSSNNPSGGGHWIVVIGYEDDKNTPGGGYWVVNDPWGEIDHASGTYISENGKMLKYSYSLMNARWTVSNSTDGWCVLAKSWID
ncbi:MULTISPECIES: C39 family peptidase [unclassified Okeania]|uniref:C39 family peptidase n=1 Tax=unclassified Okeania TaxID=2634635 RepID=UPI0013B69385|nr:MULTISPECIES: C39 family peptidase [unclassified Okeania]NES79418.1 hypothetical protein [Okeania sp. SIO1H4]NET17148.1 hypothetical protein [Okeania sp. SIO1H6]NET23091.1 hypothetical protein [Okeania sp. SIO1H5]NET97509.1 hypothetical protein [Okeania sp. SIO1H2]